MVSRHLPELLIEVVLIMARLFARAGARNLIAEATTLLILALVVL